MAILLGLDFETTGLNPSTDKIIEIGYALWDTTTNKLLKSYSNLIDSEGLEIPSEIEALTGISYELVGLRGSLYGGVFSELSLIAEDVDYFVAHNAEFEKSFLYSHGVLDCLENSEAFPLSIVDWIDTKTDIPYKPGKGKGTLNDIAMCHGVYNPMPHRALPDVLTMMQVLSQYDFAEVERYAKTPTVTMVCTFPYDETGKRQDLVKSQGYYWNPQAKWWYKPIKAFFVDEETARMTELGLKVHQAQPDDDIPF